MLSVTVPTLDAERTRHNACIRVAGQSIAAGNLPGAAYWYCRGGDTERATSTAEAALTEAEVAGCNSNAADVLDR